MPSLSLSSPVLRTLQVLWLLFITCLCVCAPVSARAQGVGSTLLGQTVTQVAAGGSHTCALTSAGAVLCWGNNGNGQLGNGTTTNSATPVAVKGVGGSGTLSGVVAIAAGGGHSCALTTAGAVLCWGNNGKGQLGDGSTITQHNAPVAVSDLGAGVAAIAAGNEHTCALTTAGAVWCWGYNYYGQLGDGSTIQRAIPVTVSGLGEGVAAIAAGRDHSCALTTAGAVLCWGDNAQGQLGHGSITPSAMPVAVLGVGGSGTLSDVAAIEAGYAHTCALTKAGAVLCWGDNINGQLGDGTTTGSATPVAVSDLSGVAAITPGAYHSCALTTAGAVHCWGNNDNGQLGDGSTTTNRATPVAVSGLSGVTVAAIAAGAHHSCALTTAGAVRCWGRNGNGQAPATLLAGQALAFAPGSAGTPLRTLALGQSAPLGTGTPGTTYGSWTGDACTVSGSTLTATGPAGGLCGVWAAHAGSAPATAAAPRQLRLLQITQAQPTLALAGSASSSTRGQSVTFTATLTGAANPTGSVTFLDGATTLGTATLSGNTATFTTSALAVGTYSLAAQYAGDANHDAATSSTALEHTVTKAQPSVTLSSSPNPSTQGQSVTFTATLSGGFEPTGDITFFNGANTLGAAQVTGTGASVTISALTAGTYSVRANYAGDANNAEASSQALTQQVNPSPVNGKCGSAHNTGLLTSTSPSANLCSAGAATSVAGGSSTWTWSCTGSNGGSAASCQSPRGYSVSTSAGANGSIGAAQTVAYNATATITLTPNAGYAVDTATGCGGTLSGNTFTTGAITADCTVSATFKVASVVVQVPEGQQVGQPITVAPSAANSWQLTQADTQTTASVGGAALPAGVTLPYGVVNLRLEQGTLGSQATVVLTYPEALPAGAVYYKYGPVVKGGPAQWYPFQGASISGNTVTLTLRDGELGDDDLEENGVIRDPGGMALLAAPAGAQAIPTLGEWALMLLGGALGLLGMGALRQRGA